ncbi:MAG: 3-methyl-2-oxobutanoate hydroxymethyltransferase, partial [Thermodesulfobacteriota bacterium]
TAHLVDKCGLDMALVGDSLAMAVLGLEDTMSVDMEIMLHHCKAVSRACKYSLVIGDMPFLSYQVSTEQAIHNAGRFLKEAGADAVKLEGGESILTQVQGIIRAGIPVQGHLGLTPQSAGQVGGFKVQAKTAQAAKKLIRDAKALEQAGCFSIVLEAIPAEIAARVTREISIPTIGIGAGADCDGQVLVFHDLVGLFDKFLPKFVKQYENLSESIQNALAKYKQEVEQGTFPDEKHSFSVDKNVLQDLDK